MAAFSAVKTIPSSSFLTPASAKATSFLAPSIAKPFSPFTSPNHSLSKSLKLNSTLTSVPKKSFTCRSQAQPVVDSGRHTQFSSLIFYSWNLTGFGLIMRWTHPFGFFAWLLCRKSPRTQCVRDQRARPWKPCLPSIEL